MKPELTKKAEAFLDQLDALGVTYETALSVFKAFENIPQEILDLCPVLSRDRRDPEYCLQENIVNIAMKASEMLLQNDFDLSAYDGFKGLTDFIISESKRYEREVSSAVDFNAPESPDYWESIDLYAEERIRDHYGLDEFTSQKNPQSLQHLAVIHYTDADETIWFKDSGSFLAALQNCFDWYGACSGAFDYQILDKENWDLRYWTEKLVLGEFGEDIAEKEVWIAAHQMDLDVPVEEANEATIELYEELPEPPVKVYAVAGRVKHEVFSGNFDECCAFIDAMNGSYLDENEFEWDLWLEDSRDFPPNYHDAVAAFSNPGTYIDSEHMRQYASELVYCHENGKSLIDFDFWTHYELVLGEKITFEEYRHIDEGYDGDPLEIDEVAESTIADIRNCLMEYRSKEKHVPLSELLSNAESRRSEGGGRGVQTPEKSME